MRRITDGLLVGDAQDVGRPDVLRDRGVERIVSVTHAEPDEPAPDGVTVQRHPLIDGPKAEFEPFAAAADAVRAAMAADERVLCHCSAGVSRSAGVVAAALAVHHDERFVDGLARVESAKPNVNPHPAIRELGEEYVTDCS